MAMMSSYDELSERSRGVTVAAMPVAVDGPCYLLTSVDGLLAQDVAGKAMRVEAANCANVCNALTEHEIELWDEERIALNCWLGPAIDTTLVAIQCAIGASGGILHRFYKLCKVGLVQITWVDLVNDAHE